MQSVDITVFRQDFKSATCLKPRFDLDQVRHVLNELLAGVTVLGLIVGALLLLASYLGAR